MFAEKTCNIDKVYDLFNEKRKKIKNINELFNFRQLIDNVDKKVKKLIENSEHACYKCQAKFIDTNIKKVKVDGSDMYICQRCSDPRVK